MSDATCKTCPHRSAGKTGRLICVRFPKSQSIEEGYTCGEHPERAPRVLGSPDLPRPLSVAVKAGRIKRTVELRNTSRVPSQVAVPDGDAPPPADVQLPGDREPGADG